MQDIEHNTTLKAGYVGSLAKMERILEETVLNGGESATSIELTGDFDKQERSCSVTHSAKYFANKAIKDINNRVSEAQSNYSSINRKDTILFRLVLGGNVGLVRAILEYMRDNHMDEELAWATGVKQHPMNNNIYKTSGWKWFNHTLRFITFLVLWAIFAISTPVFYLLHAVICRITTKLSARISRRPQLPLVFAVLSGNVEMVKLFLQFGTTLDSCDSQGNNFYHYLADKSATDPDVFSRCHQLLKEVTDPSQHDVLLQMITGRENEMGISPLEMLVMRGSVADFVRLSREEGCVGRLKMAVSYDMVTDLSDDDRDSYVTYVAETYKGVEDATNGISEETYASQKREQDQGQANYTEYEFDVTRYEQKDIYNKQSLLLQFMVQRDIQSMREADISSLLGSRYLQKWMLNKARSTGWCFWLKHAFHLAVTFVLLAVMLREGGDMNDAPLFEQFYESFIAVQQDIREEYLAAHNGTVMANTSIPHCPLSQQTVGDLNISGCVYRALLRMKKSCKLNESLLMEYSSPTNSGGFKRMGTDSRRLLNTIMWCLILYVVVDFVQRSLFLGRNLFGKQSVRAGVTVVFSRLLPGSYVDAVLNLAMFSLLLFFYFIYTGYADNYEKSFMRAIAHWDEFETRIGFFTGLKESRVAYRHFAGNIFVGCLILRFILVIHAVRLVPKIGFFVFTSKKMSILLLEFGIVYGIITVMFALVFHFVMRDETCPANKREEFETIASSIFVVYTLSIGGDNNNVFVETSNVNAKMAYAAYTVISVVLLLNVIIAIVKPLGKSNQYLMFYYRYKFSTMYFRLNTIF